VTRFAQRTLPAASWGQIAQITVIAFFTVSAAVERPAIGPRLDLNRMLSDLAQDSACGLAERAGDFAE